MALKGTMEGTIYEIFVVLPQALGPRLAEMRGARIRGLRQLGGLGAVEDISVIEAVNYVCVLFVYT